MDYTALDLIPEPILVVDREHRVIFANRKAKQVYGEGPDRCYKLSHNFDSPCYEHEGHPCPVKEILDHGLEVAGVLHVHKTEKGERYFYVIASYDSQRDLFVELHVDLSGIAETLKLNGYRPEFLLLSGPVVFFQWKNAEGLPVEFVSPNVVDLLGYSPDWFISERIKYLELIHPEDRPQVLREMQAVERTHSSFNIQRQYRLRRKDGTYVWVFDSTIPVYDSSGQLVSYFGYLINIDEKQKQEELFYVLAESNPNAVAIYDFEQNRIIYANQNASRLTGYSVEELVSLEDPLSLIFWKDREKVYEGIVKRKEGYRGPIGYRLRIVTKDNKIRWVKLFSKTAFFRDKEISVLNIIDISQEVKREKLLTKLATRDQLTGVYNRRALIDYFRRLISQAKRYGTIFSIAIIDVDNFKSINDTYGHMVGDKVLKEIARRIKKVLRKSDLFGRWGGEEFLVVLPMTSEPFMPVERIRRVIEQGEFFNGLKITISAGATTYREGDTVDSMLSRADSALYKAKAQGKNRVVVV